jgi:transcriptional regulator with XRE-family HTH domain
MATDPEPLLECGQRLRSLRVAAGFSQNSLAARIGVAGATVNRYEQGVREPDLATRRLLTGLLGSDPYAIEQPAEAAS